ncbi:hopanoid biosynthesis associated glycosyl transferase HpnI [Hyphomicrobium methylovorum]|uniref:bacteriohopanetetrol glucosamine biosynthesis glycosyltransferase HpnI n=1 Tax=Hyphomicrobium methylovorum TaxID=84 RepID=UPI0015E66F3D|nr:bacteriohopanetetrol glucosamine biosynthesis glycosyltransferase HpnI [Hyphomicrobium methylovorum]MBA2125477.1 hopanoid biosynthesis associated glycosyl transferase HpnI [Hyphomicrobium methylovorum]
MASCLWLVCTLVAIIGSLYALFAGVLVARFRRQEMPDLREVENVTLLKPLCGAEPALESNLASFCVQNYPGKRQIVLGVQDAHDPAVAAVDNLRARFSESEIDLALTTRSLGRNPKISNLAGMYDHAAYDVLILSDSDMLVRDDYVRNVMAALQQPEVGLVTCLYRGRSNGGFWARLGAAGVDQHFLPSVLVGQFLGLAKPCFGSTIALRRETLERIGGFPAFADVLADDYAMGDAVRRLGLKVSIPPFTIGHTFSEDSFGKLVAHELRWARTIRLVDPIGYAASIVTHPLPFALAAAAVSGFGLITGGILAATLASRLFVPIQVERLSGGDRGTLWLSPLRDLLSFAIFLASFAPGAVSWRGRRYRVNPDGSVTPV